jgi:hypothetical protein
MFTAGGSQTHHGSDPVSTVLIQCESQQRVIYLRRVCVSLPTIFQSSMSVTRPVPVSGARADRLLVLWWTVWKKWIAAVWNSIAVAADVLRVSISTRHSLFSWSAAAFPSSPWRGLGVAMSASSTCRRHRFALDAKRHPAGSELPRRSGTSRRSVASFAWGRDWLCRSHL